MIAVPRISVVTPSYQQGAYLERTIDSVLSQGYPNLEYIVVDGGSTDNSVEIIRKYERHLGYWVSEKDRGQSHAINKGMARASGQILAWLNSDDWYVNRALFRFAEHFTANPETGVVVGRGQTVNLAGDLVMDKSPPDPITLETICSWLIKGHFMQPSAAFSRDAWVAAGPLAEDVHIALYVDLWLRMAKANCVFVSTDELLSVALSHPNAKTTAFVDEMRLDCARVVASHGSLKGYEQAIQCMVQDKQMTNLKLAWYERNYRVVVEHPLLRILQPIVKRFSKEGGYWQASIPPWKC